MTQFNDKSGKIWVTHINIRQSIFFLVLKLILVDVIIAVLGIIYFFLISNEYASGILSGAIPLYDLSFVLIAVLIKIVLVVYIVLFWINEYYEIWPSAIMHRSGLFLRRVERHPLTQLRSLKIEQGFFGKIFNYGTIYFYNWYLKTNTSLYLIHNPIKYFRIIESLVPKSEKEKEIFLDYPDAEES